MNNNKINNMNIQSGETLSFYQLIGRYKIIIPIIQRDYAQGRVKEREVRERFLGSIFEHLENNEHLELDFIYGSIRNNDEFIPLDGQQRLTTLFLLHWYLCQVSDNQELKECFYKTIKTTDEKSKFYYETRISSTDFFNEIVNFELPKEKLENKKISDIIKNCSWYHLSWNYDPTIQGILVMLDAIHEKFKGNSIFFEKLINGSSITFKFLDLKEYHLTDELYIKMNSRGRQLTNFENFKAEFEKYIKGNLNEKDKNFVEYFSYKIDTTWSDFFWRKLSINDKSKYDEVIMNFFRVILTNLYIERHDTGDETFNENVKYLLDPNEQLSFYRYKEFNVFPEDIKVQDIQEILENIVNIFDIISNYDNSFETILTGYEFYYKVKEEFTKVFQHKFENYHKRLMFYSFISYLLKYKDNLESNQFDKDNFNQWIRVIHNLSHNDNTRIEESKDYIKSVISIKEILDHLRKNNINIIEYLRNTQTNLEGFSSWQVDEEKIKAHLISKSDKWKNEIEKIEKHQYFNGQIGFILEFSGIWDYYKRNDNCNWDDEEDKKFFNNFSRYSKLAHIIFDESYENRKNNENYIFERAVLTKGDYLTPASQNRKNLLSTNVVKNNIKRDHSWKRLLRVEQDNTEQTDNKWQDRRNFVKQVFDNILNLIEDINPDNVKQAMNNIINTRENTLENWRDFFINCPNIFEYCKQGFIRYDDEYNIRVYEQSQSNGNHAELYTFYLYKKLEKLSKIEYVDVRSIDDTPGIKISLNDEYYLFTYFYFEEKREEKKEEKRFCIELKDKNNNPVSLNDNNQKVKELVDKIKETVPQEKLKILENEITIDFDFTKANSVLKSIENFLIKVSNL